MFKYTILENPIESQNITNFKDVCVWVNDFYHGIFAQQTSINRMPCGVGVEKNPSCILNH